MLRFLVLRFPLASKRKLCVLTHLRLMFSFYAPWKHQKTFDYMMFSGSMKGKYYLEMGYTQTD